MMVLSPQAKTIHTSSPRSTAPVVTTHHAGYRQICSGTTLQTIRVTISRQYNARIAILPITRPSPGRLQHINLIAPAVTPAISNATLTRRQRVLPHGIPSVSFATVRVRVISATVTARSSNPVPMNIVQASQTGDRTIMTKSDTFTIL